MGLETPGVGEFIRAGLVDRLIRVMVTDAGGVLILPFRLWDEAARRKDRRWLKSPRPPRRRPAIMRGGVTSQGRALEPSSRP